MSVGKYEEQHKQNHICANMLTSKHNKISALLVLEVHNPKRSEMKNCETVHQNDTWFASQHILN